MEKNVMFRGDRGKITELDDGMSSPLHGPLLDRSPGWLACHQDLTRGSRLHLCETCGDMAKWVHTAPWHESLSYWLMDWFMPRVFRVDSHAYTLTHTELLILSCNHSQKRHWPLVMKAWNLIPRGQLRSPALWSGTGRRRGISFIWSPKDSQCVSVTLHINTHYMFRMEKQ